MGPITLDFEQFVGMRLNEHSLHTWDIEVVDDPTATLAPEAAALIVDNRELMAGYTARPTGETCAITITTTEPARSFTIDLSPDAVKFNAAPAASAADVMLPAESLIRLIYGRLDPEHTPAVAEGHAATVGQTTSRRHPPFVCASWPKARPSA
jgi:hypothetical protein